MQLRSFVERLIKYFFRLPYYCEDIKARTSFIGVKCYRGSREGSGEYVFIKEVVQV